MPAPAATEELTEIIEPTPARRRGSYEYQAIFLTLSIVVLILAATMSVSGGTQVVPPFLSQPLPELCHMRRLLGIDCPGCGLTRCFISLAHGDWRAAWRYNAGGILLFGMVVAQIPYRGWQMWRLSQGLPEWHSRRLVTWLSVVLVGMLLVQWCWKMSLYFVPG